MGWDLISANFNAPWTVRSHWDAYAHDAAAQGLSVAPMRWRVRRSILVTETMEEANRYLADPDNAIANFHRCMVTLLRRTGRRRTRALMAHPDMAEDEVTAESCIGSVVIAGIPDIVAGRIAEMQKMTGPFGAILTTFHEWGDARLWRPITTGSTLPCDRRAMSQEIEPMNLSISWDIPATASRRAAIVRKE